MVLVVMGVTGCGKTTVGELLASQLGWPYYDADDFHSPENKAKMHQGIPLTDEDRLPWLAALRRCLLQSQEEGKSVVMACSALKEKFREALIEGISDAHYVYLHGTKAVIAGRLAERKNHYMNPALLDSQFAALEEPNDAISVDVDQTPEAIVRQILDCLKAVPDKSRSG